MRCYSNRAAPTAGEPSRYALGTLAVRAWEGGRPARVQMSVLSATQSAQGAPWTVLLESANPAGVFLCALKAAVG
jgi:hypothetical protein